MLISTGQLRKALSKECLRARDSTSQPTKSGVHENRRHIKKARAALRLLRGALGSQEFHRHDQELRAASAQLGKLRDREVLIETLEETIARCRGAPIGGVGGLHAALVDDLRASRHRAASQWRVRRRERLLSEAGQRVDVRRSTKKRKSANKALRRIYRSGRAALHSAEQDATDRALHDLRKQAKYLNLALRLLARRGKVAARPMAKPFERLTDTLGDDHDLALLQQRVAAAELDGESNRRRLLALIGDQRSALQRRGFRSAKRLYANKPRHFQRRVEALGRGQR